MALPNHSFGPRLSAEPTRWLGMAVWVERAAVDLWQVHDRDADQALGQVQCDSTGLSADFLISGSVHDDVLQCIERASNGLDAGAQQADGYRAAIETTGALLRIPSNYGDAHQLNLMMEPVNLAAVSMDCFDRPLFLAPAAAAAWLQMQATAATQEVSLLPVSGFRDFRYQAQLIRNKLDRGQTIDEILRVNAAPGFSEHHTGNAIDITTSDSRALETEFEATPAFQWLSENAQSFGFRMSYPPDNPHGVMYEPWHWFWAG